MRRLLALAPLFALLLFLTACASVAGPGRTAEAIAPGVPLQDEPAAGPALTDKEPGFGDYALVLPKNVVWLPWKTLAGTGKGLVDGVAAGFEPDRVPILGLLFSPVNAVMGLVTGFGTGMFSEPGFIGPRTNFGRAMGLPTQRPTPIWWLPE